MKDTAAIILCAGKGSRMNDNSKSKVCFDCAGVPVIATDWKYNEEVITHGKDGIVYSVNEREKLKDILLEVAQNPDMLNKMRPECLSHAEEFSPQKGVKIIIDQLK